MKIAASVVCGVVIWWGNVQGVFAQAASPSLIPSVQAEAAQPQPEIPTPRPTGAYPIPVAPDYTPIAKHYRFGEGHPLFPAPSPTPLFDFAGLKNKIIEDSKKAAKEFPTLDEFKKYILANIKEPAVGKCLEDRTDALDAVDDFPEGLEGDSSPYQDMLFIHMKDLPPDPEIMFGATTIVVPFIPETPNKSWEYIETFEVPCLPYRVRLQKSKMYFDQGMPALKNYSKNAKGEYHPYIQELFLGKKPKPTREPK